MSMSINSQSDYINSKYFKYHHTYREKSENAYNPFKISFQNNFEEADWQSSISSGKMRSHAFSLNIEANNMKILVRESETSNVMTLYI